MGEQVTALLAVVAASGWLFVALFVLCAVDGVLPVVPGETAAITAGVLAATGGPNLAAVVIACAAGSLTGDVACYALWRRLAATGRVAPCAGGRRAAVAAWADALLTRRGGPVVLVARFLPSGRTAVSVAAGVTGFPLRRLLPWDALAALAWAVYAPALGYLGGRVSGGSPLVGVLVGLGLATVVTAGVAVARRVRRRADRPIGRSSGPPVGPLLPGAGARSACTGQPARPGPTSV